eukprot:jgi/Picsp_1/6040/NSC_03394-R1_aarf domain-containing protein kinase
MSCLPARAAVLCTAGVREFRRVPRMISQNSFNSDIHSRERTGWSLAQTAWRQKRQVLIQCRSSGTSASPRGSAPSSAEMETLFKQIGQLQQLAQEAVGLALKSGPQGIRRSAQAAEAFISVGREQLQLLQRNQASDAPPVILRKLFEKLGSTYIKLGQFIASSPTIFPEEYVLEFQRCLDQTPPVAYSTIQKIIEKELGLPLEDVFETVDPVSLATASIAQVHSAVLRGSGQDVVIKVLKPGVEDTLVTDLNFLYIASRALEIFSPDLSRASLSDIVGDIRSSMMDEVDFRKEAQHIEQFASYLDSNGLRSIATCPTLYKQYCTEKVLVMERLNGAPLVDLEAIRNTARGDPELVLVNALNVWLGSLLGAESFHADVHAGNLLVLPDGRVAFIDFGIVGRISQTTWRAVEALLRATTTGDYQTMAKALVTIGAADREVNIDMFARDLEELAKRVEDIDADLVVSVGETSASASIAADNEAVNRFLIEIIRVGEANGVKFPREFALLIKQVLYFDRYTRLLAPTMKPFEDERINLSEGVIDI